MSENRFISLHMRPQGAYTVIYTLDSCNESCSGSLPISTPLAPPATGCRSYPWYQIFSPSVLSLARSGSLSQELKPVAWGMVDDCYVLGGCKLLCNRSSAAKVTNKMEHPVFYEFLLSFYFLVTRSMLG